MKYRPSEVKYDTVTFSSKVVKIVVFGTDENVVGFYFLISDS